MEIMKIMKTFVILTISSIQNKTHKRTDKHPKVDVRCEKKFDFFFIFLRYSAMDQSAMNGIKQQYQIPETVRKVNLQTQLMQ